MSATARDLRRTLWLLVGLALLLFGGSLLFILSRAH